MCGLLCMAFFLCIQSAQANEVGVVEAFLSIPQKQLLYTRTERESFLKTATIDRANGYIKVERKNENFEFILFKRVNGALAAAISWGPGICVNDVSDNCDSSIMFFLQARDTWKNVQHWPLGKKFSKKNFYSLPRQGGVISVTDRQGHRLEKINLNELQFSQFD